MIKKCNNYCHNFSYDFPMVIWGWMSLTHATLQHWEGISCVHEMTCVSLCHWFRIVTHRISLKLLLHQFGRRSHSSPVTDLRCLENILVTHSFQGNVGSRRGVSWARSPELQLKHLRKKCESIGSGSVEYGRGTRWRSICSDFGAKVGIGMWMGGRDSFNCKWKNHYDV